jgi:hypothetical protein
MNAKSLGAPEVKRRYTRKILNCRAALFRGKEVCHANLFQISEGGLLFSCPKDLAINEGLEFQFYLTESGYLTLKGYVIYQLKGQQHTPENRYGFRFVGLEIFDKILIQGFIRHPKA